MFIFAAFTLIAGCSSEQSSDQTAPATTTETPPFPVGEIGTPLKVRGAGGSTADITLTSAEWIPGGCECSVIGLTITGTSRTDFPYSGDDVVVGYGGGTQPWTNPTQPGPGEIGFGGVDYQSINRLPPLRSGTVREGQTVHGFIGFPYPGRHLYVRLLDRSFTSEAGWEIQT